MGMFSQISSVLFPSYQTSDTAVKPEPKPEPQPVPGTRITAKPEPYIDPVLKERLKRGSEQVPGTRIQAYPKLNANPVPHSTKWDYRSPYRGGCDNYVLNNPPTGFPTGVNASGNRWSSLGNGAFHYSNYGTDGGFYVQNSDGSCYHFSPYYGGRYKSADESW